MKRIRDFSFLLIKKLKQCIDFQLKNSIKGGIILVKQPF
jgi:hypothetical protein